MNWFGQVLKAIPLPIDVDALEMAEASGLGTLLPIVSIEFREAAAAQAALRDLAARARAATPKGAPPDRIIPFSPTPTDRSVLRGLGRIGFLGAMLGSQDRVPVALLDLLAVDDELGPWMCSVIFSASA